MCYRLGKVVERRFVVRQQRQVHHPHYNSLSQWRCICIEEPFTLSVSFLYLGLKSSNFV
jgi:hypothetical protein